MSWESNKTAYSEQIVDMHCKKKNFNVWSTWERFVFWQLKAVRSGVMEHIKDIHVDGMYPRPPDLWRLSPVHWMGGGREKLHLFSAMLSGTHV